MDTIAEEVAVIIQKYSHTCMEVGEKVINLKSLATLPTDTTQMLKLDVCIPTLLRGAVQKAQKLRVSVAISIVDWHGHSVFFYRMEDALLISSELAKIKAYTAVAFRMETEEIGKEVAAGQPLQRLESMLEHPIATIAGGFPIWYKGRLLGGIGISGGTLVQDREIGYAAIKAL